jgi:hypothetical protein
MVLCAVTSLSTMHLCCAVDNGPLSVCTMCPPCRRQWCILLLLSLCTVRPRFCRQWCSLLLLLAYIQVQWLSTMMHTSTPVVVNNYLIRFDMIVRVVGSFFQWMLVVFLRWTQRPVQQSTIKEHCVVWRARFLAEYIPAICTALGIGSCLTLLEFSTPVSDKQPRRGAHSVFVLHPCPWILCLSPATLNAQAWNPWLVGCVELGTSATPLKSQSCGLGLDSQIAGTFFYILRVLLIARSNSFVLEYDCVYKTGPNKIGPMSVPRTEHVLLEK